MHIAGLSTRIHRRPPPTLRHVDLFHVPQAPSLAKGNVSDYWSDHKVPENFRHRIGFPTTAVAALCSGILILALSFSHVGDLLRQPAAPSQVAAVLPAPAGVVRVPAALPATESAPARQTLLPVTMRTSPFVSLPAQPAAVANSLPTGTRISADQSDSGNGELEAVNNTHLDACVILIEGDRNVRVRKVYIKAQESFVLDRLSQGSYRVLFATGVDWNNAEEHFNRDATYFNFGKVLNYTETRDARVVHYERFSIHMSIVSDGNVLTRPITEAEFHALSGKV